MLEKKGSARGIFFARREENETPTPTLLRWDGSKNTWPLIDISWHRFSPPPPWTTARLLAVAKNLPELSLQRWLSELEIDGGGENGGGRGGLAKTKLKQRGPDGWYLGYWDPRRSWLMASSAFFLTPWMSDHSNHLFCLPLQQEKLKTDFSVKLIEGSHNEHGHLYIHIIFILHLSCE